MRSSILILIVLAFTLLAPLASVWAQSVAAVQELWQIWWPVQPTRGANIATHVEPAEDPLSMQDGLIV